MAVALAGMIWSGTLRSSAPIAAETVAAETVAVADAQALARALDAAQGGETLQLAPGEYGELFLKKRTFSPPVTLAASPEGAVRFTRIELVQSSGLTFVNLTLTGDLKATQNSARLTVQGCRIGIDGATGTAVYMRDVQDLVLADNRIRAGHHGIIFNDVTGAVLRDSLVREAREDLLRITGRARDILVENNAFIDVAADRPLHPDAIQVFGYDGNTPTDLIFRGNFVYDDPETGSVFGQGIFLAGPHGAGFRNVLIEQNLINVGSPNSIYMDGGQENVVIRHNSLIPWPGDGGAVIRLDDKSGRTNEGTSVYGNVAKLLLDETRRSEIGNNYFYGRKGPLARLFSGPGTRWQDFVPLPGSVIDFGSPFGAQDRLRALQAAG